MGFSSLFQRQPDRASRPKRQAAPLDPASVEVLRARARRRFVGAAVLVIGAVVVLPLVLESEPRPLPSSVAIQMPARDVARDGAAPVSPERPATALPAAPAVETPAPLVKPEPSPAAKPSPKPAAEAPRAEPKPPAARKPESATRYVIQVGAYADSAKVKEARQRIEKLGLSSLQQDVETSSGRRTRVRLGPYATREEADRVAARLRAAGLSAALLAI